MALFSSRFKALEALADAKPEARTPEMLNAAQVELDSAKAGVLLVPTTSQFKTGADLDKHIESLEKTSKDEKKRADDAEAKLTTANAEVTRLKAIVPADKQADTPEQKEEKQPNAENEQTPEAKAKKELQAKVDALPHNKAMREHFEEV